MSGGLKTAPWRGVACALLLAVFWGSLVAAQDTCRQALALGMDVSGSVDAQEYQLQINGLANALANPEVAEKILAMPEAPIRLAVFEWSGPQTQVQLIPWTTLATEQDLSRVIAQLRASPRQPEDVSTAIGAALRYGLDLLSQQERCWKRTLDISGDGKSNTGPHPGTLAKAGLPVTINGLVIGADDPNMGDIRFVEVGELSSYYHAYVVHGPGAFVETAIGFRDFERAMTRKLLRELEGLTVSALPADTWPGQAQILR